MLGDWKGLNVYLWCESFSEAGNSLSILKDQISVAGRKRRGGRQERWIPFLLPFFSFLFFFLSKMMTKGVRSKRYK